MVNISLRRCSLSFTLHQYNWGRVGSHQCGGVYHADCIDIIGDVRSTQDMTHVPAIYNCPRYHASPPLLHHQVISMWGDDPSIINSNTPIVKKPKDLQSLLSSSSLKWKYCLFDEIIITGCTGSCHFDNFQCSQQWKFHQNVDISISMLNTLKLRQNGRHLADDTSNAFSC